MEETQKGKKKRSVILLILSLFLLGITGYFIYAYSPQTLFPQPIPIGLQPIFVFFGLVFLATTTLVGYIGNSMRRGVFFGIFICSYLLLRLNHFTDTYFVLILLGLYISLEVFFTRYH